MSTILDNRPRQHHVWKRLSSKDWFATFVPGDCSANPLIKLKDCRFTRPWLSDVSYYFIISLNRLNYLIE